MYDKWSTAVVFYLIRNFVKIGKVIAKYPL